MNAHFLDIWTLASVALVLINGVTAIPPPSPFTVRFAGKNLNAPLVVLDYGSLSSLSAINSEDKCETACRTVAGCNAYVYCDDANGCGNGCDAYVRANPKLPPPSGSSNYRTQPLPITKFGSFAAGTGCHPTNPTKWPKGLCSLKKVADPENPAFSPVDGTVWKSGVIKFYAPWTTSCDGVPLNLCNQCANFYTPVGSSNTYSQCLSCAKGVTTSAGGATTLQKATAAWACHWCLQKQGVDPTLDRGQCFRCVQRHGFTGLPYLCSQ